MTVTVEVIVTPATREDAKRIVRQLMAVGKDKKEANGKEKTVR